jgi:hypothetical protein
MEQVIIPIRHDTKAFGRHSWTLLQKQ